jgi:hypothetical protein
MGLAYRLRPVDMLAGVETDAEFLAVNPGGVTLGEAERAYVARTSAREAYRRAMETCQGTKAWAARADSGQ